MPDDLLNLAAIEKLKREAFVEGRAACLAALGKAMREASMPMLPTPKMPREGTTQRRVLEGIKTYPGHQTSEVIEYAQHHFHEETSPASVRVALTRLKAKNLIVARGINGFRHEPEKQRGSLRKQEAPTR